MDWIELHTTLRQHPKLRRLKRHLDLPRYAALGIVADLWLWAADHALDGSLAHLEPDDIADIVGWEGDPDELVKALIDCGPKDTAGFLDRAMTIHDWDTHTRAFRAAQDDGRRNAHVRWHLNRANPSTDCKFCIAEGLVSSPDPSPPTSADTTPMTPQWGPNGPHDHDSSHARQTKNRRSDGGPMPPQWGPNAPDLTRPNPTGPNQTKPPPPPTPSSNELAATGLGALRAAVAAGAGALPDTLDGTWRSSILPRSGSPKDHTRAVLDHIAAGHLPGDRPTLMAAALADHLATIPRHRPVGTGGVHQIRSLLQDHTPAAALDQLDRAGNNPDVRNPISWAGKALAGGTP